MSYIEKEKVLEITARYLPPKRFQELIRLPEQTELMAEWEPVTVGTPENQVGVSCSHCGAEFYSVDLDFIFVTNDDIRFCPCCGARMVNTIV